MFDKLRRAFAASAIFLTQAVPALAPAQAADSSRIVKQCLVLKAIGIPAPLTTKEAMDGLAASIKRSVSASQTTDLDKADQIQALGEGEANKLNGLSHSVTASVQKYQELIENAKKLGLSGPDLQRQLANIQRNQIEEIQRNQQQVERHASLGVYQILLACMSELGRARESNTPFVFLHIGDVERKPDGRYRFQPAAVTP